MAKRELISGYSNGMHFYCECVYESVFLFRSICNSNGIFTEMMIKGAIYERNSHTYTLTEKERERHKQAKRKFSIRHLGIRHHTNIKCVLTF